MDTAACADERVGTSQVRHHARGGVLGAQVRRAVSGVQAQGTTLGIAVDFRDQPGADRSLARDFSGRRSAAAVASAGTHRLRYAFLRARSVLRRPMIRSLHERS